MKKSNFVALCIAFCTVLLLPSVTQADVMLEYIIKNEGITETINRYVAVKDDRIFLKAADDHGDLDLLYCRSPEGLLIVDHKRCRLTTVDEAEVERINRQAQYLLPLVKTFGQQLERLSPDQREKWQKLLGEAIPLDMITKAAGPVVPTNLELIEEKKVKGINCRVMQFLRGPEPVAEICLADAAGMQICEKDAATVHAFFDFYEKLAGRSTALAGLFGLTLPDPGPCGTNIIPVEIKDLSNSSARVIKLHRIDRSRISPDLMVLPAAYETVPLTFWQ